MLRHPVNRVSSLYHFILEREDHHSHQEIVKNNHSLKDFVESGFNKLTDNGQLRLLSNKTNVRDGTLNDYDLAFAKANLEKYFTVVGLTEQFDATILLLQTQYSWKWPYYRRVNITKIKPNRAEITMVTVDAIMKSNVLDMQLYEWAEERFNYRVNLLGPEFEKQLKHYKKMNSLFQKGLNLKDKILPGKF